MQLIFDHGKDIEINLLPGEMQNILLFWFKHLGRVPIPWRAWDYPKKFKNIHTKVDLAHKLQAVGIVLDINVDISQLHSRPYLNDLHCIYEKRYNGDPAWLDYHEILHFIENMDLENPAYFYLNYRQLAGLLKKPFQQQSRISTCPYVQLDHCGSNHRMGLSLGE